MAALEIEAGIHAGLELEAVTDLLQTLQRLLSHDNRLSFSRHLDFRFFHHAVYELRFAGQIIDAGVELLATATVYISAIVANELKASIALSKSECRITCAPTASI